MLQNIKDIYGNRLKALDGDIGHVKDFYFDDRTWAIRYLVADTGGWLTGRQVLLSPHAFAKWDRFEGALYLKLNRIQIENSPPIESHMPISRQYEIEYYRYYGWPAYWNGGAMLGLGGYPVVMPPSKEMTEGRLHPTRDDKHLQSIRALSGYSIQTADGTIGSVSSVLVDDRSWAIHEWVVETGHWFSGKEILIPRRKIERISYEESKVFVTLTKEDIQGTADNEIAKAGAGRPVADKSRN
jgi:hypothetical protein